MNRQFLRFIIVGIFNTIIGLSAIYSLIYFGVNNYIANIFGYMLGLTVGYILNKYYVFGVHYSNKNKYGQFVKYLVIFIIAYTVNIVILFIALKYMTGYLAQFISMGAYTIINFILNKYITFKDSKYV